MNLDTDFAMEYLVKSHENTTIWLYAHFQLATVILALSSFTKFQSKFHENKLFILYWILVFGCMSWMLLNGSGEALYYAPGIPTSFRYLQYTLVVCQLVASVAFERGLVWYFTERLETKSGERPFSGQYEQL